MHPINANPLAGALEFGLISDLLSISLIICLISVKKLIFPMYFMQLGHSLRYLSQFFVGFIMGFSSVWQLTLLTLAIVPLVVVAGGTYTTIMSSLSRKGETAYAEAGKVAEEVAVFHIMSLHIGFVTASLLSVSMQCKTSLKCCKAHSIWQQKVYARQVHA